MKKFLSLVLALVMTMSLVTVGAGAKDFDDNADITYVEAVDVMSDVGIVDGDTAGNFNPQNGLTRGAAAKIICNLILGPTTAAELNADTDPFVDVDKDSVFAGYIAYCAKEGIVGGYADGTFKPAAPLTGYAFMKMLLGALGYDAAVEGYTGANWSINVAKQAIGIGLNADLVDNFNGSDFVTREEAMLYAFNTMKATMVDYDTTITIGDVTVAGSNEYDVANNARVETIADDNKMQFAEKYFTKLSVKSDVDAFERPSNTWTYGKETIGTYVDYTQIVGEWTTAVDGVDMYNAIGKTAVENYEFAAYVDSAAWGSAKFRGDITEEISKNNKSDVSYTGNGTLTQVFVNNDTEEVVVTMINTYLAQAIADYNAKKDVVSFEVFDPYQNGETYQVIEVSGEDFDIADVKEDDFVLITATWNATDRGTIQTIGDVETIEDTDIQKFTRGKAGSLTVDGTEYDYNTVAEYDVEVLADYTGISAEDNLKDLTYNIYLDQYGYILGVDLVSVPDNYLFVTGFDGANSHLANKPWSANAIFLDGTSKVIDVKDGAIAFATWTDAEEDGTYVAADSQYTVNSWFKYTETKTGTYELELVYFADSITDVEEPASKIAQWWDNETTEIDAKHISLEGNDEVVYGNAASIYLLADIDTVNGVDVIAGVDEVVTGVKNAAFDTVAYSDLGNVVAFPLYKSNGYVVASIVVGESATIASDVAYFLNSSVDSESYDKTTGLWTWTRTAIIGGEEVVLKEVNDTGVSDLEDARGYVWNEVKYDANGNVKEIDELVEDVDWVDTMAEAVALVEAEEELVLVDTYDEEENKFVLKGNTMYDETNAKKGVLVDEDVNVVLEQEVKNVLETELSVGVKSLEAILANLNENEGDYTYYVAAIIEDGIATTVIVMDIGPDGAYDGPESDATINAAIVVEVDTDTGVITVEDETGEATDAEIMKAIASKLVDMDIIPVEWTEGGVSVVQKTAIGNVNRSFTITEGAVEA